MIYINFIFKTGPRTDHDVFFYPVVSLCFQNKDKLFLEAKYLIIRKRGKQRNKTIRQLYKKNLYQNIQKQIKDREESAINHFYNLQGKQYYF